MKEEDWDVVAAILVMTSFFVFLGGGILSIHIGYMGFVYSVVIMGFLLFCALGIAIRNMIKDWRGHK